MFKCWNTILGLNFFKILISCRGSPFSLRYVITVDADKESIFKAMKGLTRNLKWDNIFIYAASVKK